MTSLSPSRRLRWAVPAVVAAGISAAAITTTTTSAGASQPNLPPRTAAQLLAAVEQTHPADLVGTVVETTKIGLPELPSGDLSGGDLSLSSLLTGSHTMRIWYGGPGQQRLAILAQDAEQDVIHNDRNLWTFTSTTNEVSHTTLHTDSGAGQLHEAPGTELTPQQTAVRALRAIDPSTRVAVDRTAEVAGRAAYQLDLIPRNSRSLIGSVRIAIDSATSTPLQVQIFARGASSPAIQVGFTDISFSAPNPSVFDFVKPVGATEVPFSAIMSSGSTRPPGSHASNDGARTIVLGSGWTSVMEFHGGGELAGTASGLLQEMSTPVPDGRLIRTALLSILITHRGTVYAGPVNGQEIQRVAATGHGL